MRIRASDSMAGIPILRVRDALRRAPFAWDGRYLARSLGVPAKKARELLQVLNDRGYAEPSESFPRSWLLTTEGNAFAIATAARPIMRATAERALRGLLERASELNADPRFILKVVKIELFGSYLDSAIDRLGDVDVIIEFQPKRPETWDGDIRHYEPVYPHGGSIFEMVTAHDLDVRKHLRGRSRVLSLHEVRERTLVPEAERRVVFEA